MLNDAFFNSVLDATVMCQVGHKDKGLYQWLGHLFADLSASEVTVSSDGCGELGASEGKGSNGCG